MLDQPIHKPDCPDRLRVDAMVAMTHVADVEASARFYTMLGFACVNRYSSPEGITNWAELISGQARLFLARANEPIIPSQQAVLFYMYSPDVNGLRDHLLARGLEDGGIPPGFRRRGEEGHMPNKNACYQICHPFYMPDGELRVQDLDGYTILVGQLG